LVALGLKAYTLCSTWCLHSLMFW